MHVRRHNGWKRETEDDSSRVTASSVFDFNGDGAAEVVYNDECFFRIYDGSTASVLFKHRLAEPHPHREPGRRRRRQRRQRRDRVSPRTTRSAACSAGTNYPNGIDVFGDASDRWVSARRIWNQHAYHVTNVLEGGAIPLHEPESWKPYNGRLLQHLPSESAQLRRGTRPDASGIQVSSPDATCGQLSSMLDITVEIENLGDLRVGLGLCVTLYGDWANPMLFEPLYADAAQTPAHGTPSSKVSSLARRSL